jgi:acyl-CoA synthetase (AMP-forming)/AMP-acid ligase II
MDISQSQDESKISSFEVHPLKCHLIVGGENIFPLEIENLLFAHSGILQASVVAVADEKYGEVVGAFIERDPHARHGPAVMREEVRKYVGERLARFKVPKYVFFLGEDGIPGDWPVTASGKIRKVELRAWADAAAKSGRVK